MVALLSLNVNAHELRVMSDEVQQFLRDAADLRPVMDEIGSSLVASTIHRFEIEKGPDGQGWTPSARAKAEGGKTLTDTARLRQSITHSASASSVAVGTNVIYAGRHQFGGEVKHYARSQEIYRTYNANTGELGRRFVKKSRANFASWVTIGEHVVNMPARPFLGVDAADTAEIGEIIADHMREALS